MTAMESEITKGHEFFLRHLLLLCKAATIPLRAIVKRICGKRNENFEHILIKSKLTLQILLAGQYFILFPGDTVNVDTMSWDTRLLCKVILLLFESDLTETERDAIACIMEQWNDLNNYAVSASLDYKTYEKKWGNLQSALFEMLTTSTTSTTLNQKAYFECIRLMISFAKEPIQVNMSLIENLKENKDITEHVKMATGYEVNSSDDDSVSEVMGAIEDDVTNNTEVLPGSFSTKLQETIVYENEQVVLTCETNSEDSVIQWYKSSDCLIATNNISFSKDGRIHCLEILAASLDDTGIYSCQSLNGKILTTAFVIVKELPRWFTSNLQNVNVFENEKIVLECELNVEKEWVKWFKSSDRLDETGCVSFKKYGRKHYLEITSAGLQDTGMYSCLSGDQLTSAYVNVKEIRVEFIEHLANTEVFEGEDVTLTCEVDVFSKTATWLHDDKEIQKFGVRRSISSNGKKHSLTILNAIFYDEGKYRVAFGELSSEAILTVNDTTSDLHKQQLTKQNYKNWVRGALSLLYLKQGLIEFTNRSMKKQHGDFLQKLPTPTVQCTHCNLETLIPFKNHANNKTCYKRSCLCLKKPTPPQKRALCPNGGFCSKFYDLVLAEHRHADVCLANADIPAWISDPWSMGTCFINTPGYKNKKSAQEIDCSGILSVIVNDRFINAELGDVRINGKSDIFKQARDARNDILHNPNYELSESELVRYIDLFKNVLEVRNAANKKPLENEPGVAEALQNLDRLKTRQIDIDEEVNRSTKTLGEQELADIYEKAKKEMEEKVNTLEENLKEKENLLRQFRHCESQDQKTKFEVVFDLTIIVSGSTAEKTKINNAKILDSVRHALQSSDRRNPSTSTLDLATETETLVDVLDKIPGVEINLADDTALIMKISVTSYDGLNGFLTLMNGNVLRQKLFKIRKCMEKDNEEAIVVNADITSGDFNKQLSTTHILNDKHGDFKCKNHPWMQNTWFCIGHGEFCCTTCKANDHRTCEGIKKVISETTDRKGDESLLTMIKKKEYYVKFYIFGMCILPDHNVLLADDNRLKKLNSYLNLVSHCDLPHHSMHVCYIGNDVAVVNMPFKRCLQFVDITGNMRLKQKIPLTFHCYGLACHGDTLYVSSDHGIYTVKIDGTRQQLLYRGVSNDCFCDIAVSDDGERIYLLSPHTGLETIDSEGNHQSTIGTDELYDVGNVCTVGDGTVLIYKTFEKCVVQVDYEGKRILGTVVPTTDDLAHVMSLCFDRQHCRLMVGRRDYDNILVFQLK